MNYRTGKIAVEYGTNVYEMEEQTDNEQSNHIVARLIRRCLRRYLRHYQRLHVVTVRRALIPDTCDQSLHTLLMTRIIVILGREWRVILVRA